MLENLNWFWRWYAASEILTSSLKEKLKKLYSGNDIIFIEKESTHTVSEHALSGECDDYELIDTILGDDFIDIEIMCNMQCYLFSLISWIPVIMLLSSTK